MPISQPTYLTRTDDLVTHIGAYTDAQIALSVLSAVNSRTASYTLTVTDATKTVVMNVAWANTLTVPNDSTASLPIGSVVQVVQLGAGATTIAAANGVTIGSIDGSLQVAAQHGLVRLWKRAANTWQASGDLAPAQPTVLVPVNQSAPVVSGTATEGQTLPVSTGNWTNSPTSYAYQWQSKEPWESTWADITGATAATIVLGAGDAWHTMRCRVIASNAAGAGNAAYSAATAAVTPTTGIFVSTVSTGGSDANPGTLASPKATVTGASGALSLITTGNGDRVIMRGGEYNQQVNSSKSGADGDPIILRSYPGESAIIDGTGVSLAATDGLVQITGSYWEVSDLEIRDSQGRGIVAYSNGVALRFARCVVHNIQRHGVLLSCSNSGFVDGEVYQCSMHNANGYIDQTAGSGWAYTCGTGRRPDGARATGIYFINNWIHEAWGEGINLVATTNAKVAENRIRNVFSVYLYSDRSDQELYERNICWRTDTAYDRYNGTDPHGCLIANESDSVTTIRTGMISRNNIFANVKNIWHYWQSGGGTVNNTYTAVKVLGNVGYSLTDASVIVAGDTGSFTAPANCECRNNIMYGGGLSVAAADIGGWAFSHNIWTAGIPPTGTHTNSLAPAGSSLFVSPNSAGDQEGFRLQAGSPAINAGVWHTSLPDDFDGVTRANPPDIGAFEY